MGVYARVLDFEGERIDEAKWAATIEIGHPVGLCDYCKHFMKGLPREEHNDVVYYSMECSQCGREVTLPRGEIPVRRGRRRVA